MKQKASLALVTVLLVACVVLCALRAADSIALPVQTTPPPTSAPTPHVHLFDPETACCTLCGAVCDHAAGFDEAHRCLVCGWTCHNSLHDPETALCPICGEAFYHRFGMDGVCEVCLAAAPLYDGTLPDRFFEPSAHEGRCLRETLTDASRREWEIAVWLPWDYSEERPCNVVVLLHGDGGSGGDWTDVPERTERGEIEFRHVYDRIVEERLCAPFLIVGIPNASFERPADGEAFLRELVLPHIAQRYATWLGDGSPEALRAGREHVAVGGLSRGSMYTYSCVMPRCLDLVGSFCCFSNGDNMTVYRQLMAENNRDWPILSYIASYGTRDVPEYGMGQRAVYRNICANVERVTDGENARMLVIDGGHDFLMWTASLYDALLLMF